jgi:MFS family permease
MNLQFNQMTQNQRWLSRKFLIYKFLTNLWFVGAVWLYFYRLFITDREIGILDGTAFAIGLFAEVPSGVLADKYGRDKMVKVGQVLAGGGLLIQAFGTSFVPFVVGQAIMMIGVSFVSGADEALFFDKLQFNKTSVEWRKLITKGTQVALIGSTVAIIAGGWLHSFDPRIPWILTGLSFISSVFLIWPIKEVRPVKEKQKLLSELKEQLGSIRLGFLEFITPKLFLYVPIIVVTQGLFYTAGWGLLRLVLLDRFYFSPFAGSIVIATSSLITVGILAHMHKYADSMSEKRVLTLISVLAGSSLLLSVANIGMWGYFVILALYVGEHVLQPFMSEVLNYRTGEDRRATVLSVSSFLRTLPYVGLAPIIGYLNTQDKLEYFLIAWAILIGLATAFYLFLKKRDAQISLTKEVSETELRVPEISTEE